MTRPLPLLITSDQVADLLGLADRRAFLAQRARLEDQTLFPPPVPVQRRIYRWRRDEVLAWIARQGRPADPLPALPPQARLPLASALPPNVIPMRGL